jgi:hypothetical protein
MSTYPVPYPSPPIRSRGASGGGAPAVLNVLEVVIDLTETEYENLNTVPKLLVAGIPGVILRPLIAQVQINVTVAYAGSTTLFIRHGGLTGVSLVNTITPVMTAIARVSGQTNSTAGLFSSAAGNYPTGLGLVLTGSALLAGGTITVCQVWLSYMVVPNGL